MSNMNYYTLLCFGAAYFIGAIPTSYIIVKLLKKVDIREYGSKNVGATNAGRILGKKWFFIIMLLDVLKGIIPILITKKVLNTDINAANGYLIFITGIIAVIGHTFPVYLNFKGGKGVAVTAGVFLMFDYRLLIIGLIVFILIVFITKYISAGSITASLSLPISELILYKNSQNYYLLSITILISLYIIFKHRENIKRIINKTERKWGERI